MYRFLVERRTLWILAALWLGQAILLFGVGWLVGRQDAPATVDRAQVRRLLDEAVPTTDADADNESIRLSAQAAQRTVPEPDATDGGIDTTGEPLECCPRPVPGSGTGAGSSTTSGTSTTSGAQDPSGADSSTSGDPSATDTGGSPPPPAPPSGSAPPPPDASDPAGGMSNDSSGGSPPPSTAQSDDSSAASSTQPSSQPLGVRTAELAPSASFPGTVTSAPPSTRSFAPDLDCRPESMVRTTPLDGFAVQIAALRADGDRQEICHLIASLRDLGYHPYLSKDGSSFTKVRIGTFDDRGEAESAIRVISDRMAGEIRGRPFVIVPGQS